MTTTDSNMQTPEQQLANSIRASELNAEMVSTTLKTDERVIARVTDGVYRQPGSAIRELISNAYDADATKVIIKTDAPRFEKITIEDDGHGMSPEALAHLFLHIGGSAKRNIIGHELGVTSPTDPLRSPSGRKLIGKIGIGLFSVSQLTHKFQIITKVKGDDYRTVATVALRQYADEEQSALSESHEFESGKVKIWREKAADIKSHGTTIILTSIRSQARDTLRSEDIWSAIKQEESLSDGGSSISPPKYHVGSIDSSSQLLKMSGASTWSLPWDKGDDPDVAFKKLVQSVWDEAKASLHNAKLEKIYDYYLQMVWQLSLAIPLPYIDKHLFDTPMGDWVEGAYLLSNQGRGSKASIIDISSEKTLRELQGLNDKDEVIGGFDVFIDDLKLSRPIKYQGLPFSNQAIKKPIIFIGKCREVFDNIPRELSGGPLSFEAYLFWNPKIAPTEHQGSLIRIHGSSGTLFDASFMRYQVAEITRLRQITCEIFVTEGLDSALNIDRESFNHAHPHSVFITRWLHNALRQLITVQKRIGSERREFSRDQNTSTTLGAIKNIARDVWQSETGDLGSEPPEIELSSTGKSQNISGESYVFDQLLVMPIISDVSLISRSRNSIAEEKLKAITQVLASYGVLDTIPRNKQERMLSAIYKILEVKDE